MKRILVSLLVTPLLSLPILVVGQTIDELTSQVRALEVAFAHTMEMRDFELFQSYIASNAIFFGDEGVMRGRDAVASGWRSFFDGDTAPFSWTPNQVEVLESGTLAHSSDPVFDAEGVQFASYNSIWRRDDQGRWKVIFDKGCAPSAEFE